MGTRSRSGKSVEYVPIRCGDLGWRCRVESTSPSKSQRTYQSRSTAFTRHVRNRRRQVSERFPFFKKNVVFNYCEVLSRYGDDNLIRPRSLRLHHHWLRQIRVITEFFVSPRCCIYVLTLFYWSDRLFLRCVSGSRRLSLQLDQASLITVGHFWSSLLYVYITHWHDLPQN